MGTINQLEIEAPLLQTLFFDSALGSADGIKSSPGTLFSVAADNTLNSSASYIRLFDLASADVTNGVTSPDWILKVLPNVANVFYFNGRSCGLPFGVALSASASTSAGTSGSTPPAMSMKVTICYA